MKYFENKEAVSPVVGVMLMLVVTLIIAGVVSAFGGGLVSTTSSTPQASISSSLTLGDSLKLQHNGGESIVGSAIDIKTKVVSGMYADMNSDVVLKNSTLLRTNSTVVSDTFQTGDVIRIPWKDAFEAYLPGSLKKGDMVTVTVFDKNSGKQISSQTVTVN